MGITNYKGRDIPNRALKSERSTSSQNLTAASRPANTTQAKEYYVIDAKTVSLSNTPLNGLTSHEGYTLLENDIILVNGQSTATENGLYTAKTGNWIRIVQDPNYNYRVLIRKGNKAGTEWRFEDPYKRIGLDDIEYKQVHAKYSIIDETILLNSTQIKNINTAPIPFLSAQGANTVIDPISCTATLNWNTSAYLALGTPPNLLYLSFETSPGIYSDIFKVSDALITASGADLTVKLEDNDGLTFNQLVSNSPLIIRGDSDYITGNSTITLQLLYRVLEV
tara:strand:+ start:3390 stop:4229 length:840 start_codon:yes stop_codon:yes gene_type:complete